MKIILTAVMFSGIFTVCAEEVPDLRTIRVPQKVLVAAHRGAGSFAPENTLAAFCVAVELGADYIEIDVRKTQDNVNVILHDSTLDRTTDGKGLVGEWNLEDLQALTAGPQWSSDRFGKQRIPTLEQTCRIVRQWNEKFDRSAQFYVDCKDPDIPSLLETLKRYQFLEKAVFYGSDERLLEIRAICPEARIMPALRDPDRLDERIETIRPYALDVPWKSLSPTLIENAHAQGVKIFSDAPGHVPIESLRETIYHGIDLIQTDHLFHVYQAELQ